MAHSDPPITQPIIRPAQPSDSEGLSQLANAVFRHTYGAVIPSAILTPYLARVFSPTAIQLAIHEPATQLLVAAQGNRLLGYSKCAPTVPPASVRPGRVLELGNLYVDPAHQGRGLGKALLHQAMQHAAAQGFTTLWLCVWQANQPALHFYQSLGFTLVGETVIDVDGVRFDDWVMQKTLAL